MSSKYFPNINEDQILLINRVFRSISENPEYLNDPDCFYSETVRDFFRKTGAAAPVAAVETDEVAGVEKQIQSLLTDLEAYGKTLGPTDSSEKLQYFKTKNSLIEKILTNLERASNLKQINQFRDIVIQFMDEILEKDQITEFMKRIDGVLTNGK